MKIIGIIFGLGIIIFRKSISKSIESAYKNLPKYEDGVKSLNMKFELRPIFVGILGSVIFIVYLFFV